MAQPLGINHVALDAMGLGGLEKSESARAELRAKGLAQRPRVRT
jgi:hypothetical protein